MEYSKSELQVIELMKKICPDFSDYSFLKTDRYKGSLYGGYNIYYKLGSNGELGMVTGKKNHEKYGLNDFDKNFKTTTKLNGSEEEEGWTGEVLLKVLKRIEERS
ncbi:MULTISPECIES: hypothetical protein [Carnobacterium]|uniref:hypothetical protein n=1 Tax=Carnobacterium TaxID=2747 RepID=UPI001071F79D|nr:hypothetical protein [Carnobacterium maltaromaticum]TFJ77725.1 hypothetical protein CKN94_00425 [Carnobacterium maltaromaticum]TFJ79790.1 hypothetical protein CKN97_00425 [Carnobacterium maltaromaticum]